MNTVISVENLSKQYRLGQVSTWLNPADRRPHAERGPQPLVGDDPANPLLKIATCS